MAHRQRTMDPDVEDLVGRVRSADYSLANPNIQLVIAGEVENWVKSLEHKVEARARGDREGDVYGEIEDPASTPEQVYIDDVGYTPQEILEHVQARDEVGQAVMERIHEGWREYEDWLGDSDVVLSVWFDEDEIKSLCGIPEEIRPQAVIAFGYPKEIPNKPPKYPLETVVYFNKWRAKGRDDAKYMNDTAAILARKAGAAKEVASDLMEKAKASLRRENQEDSGENSAQNER